MRVLSYATFGFVEAILPYALSVLAFAPSAANLLNRPCASGSDSRARRLSETCPPLDRQGGQTTVPSGLVAGGLTGRWAWRTWLSPPNQPAHLRLLRLPGSPSSSAQGQVTAPGSTRGRDGPEVSANLSPYRLGIACLLSTSPAASPGSCVGSSGAHGSYRGSAPAIDGKLF